jgi:bifunctional DNA-binding transcriptional regulator/antitoxin component of YhaV-PrlF toxin-antitoxin module
MTKLVRSLRSGQITIPSDFREELGIDVDTLLQVSLIHGELRIKPVKALETVGGSSWAKELYDIFSPVRKKAKDKGLSEEKINTAIDAAVKAARSKQ